MYFQVNVDNSKKLISVGGGVVVKESPRIFGCLTKLTSRWRIMRGPVSLVYATVEDIKSKLNLPIRMQRFQARRLVDRNNCCWDCWIVAVIVDNSILFLHGVDTKEWVVGRGFQEFMQILKWYYGCWSSASIIKLWL